MKLLLVNTVATGGSIPAYMRAIADEASRQGLDVTVAYGRGEPMTGVRNIRIGNAADHAVHGLATRLFDRHGLASRAATRRFIAQAQRFLPDIIHLHNIHGYYLHYPTLFAWLREYGKPVLWSLHDCWAFTGHCAFFRWSGGECHRWKEKCGHCPLLRQYPASRWIDRSKANLRDKTLTFHHLPPLSRFLPVSEWMSDRLAESHLADIDRTKVGIDIDTSVFYPRKRTTTRRVLGVANVWDDRKGLDFFIRLRHELPRDIEIRLIGRINRKMPDGIDCTGIIADPRALAEEYSGASVFVSASHAESYGLCIREALACGCAVAVRGVGGTLEDLDNTALPLWKADDDDSLIEAVRAALRAPEPDRAACAEHFARRPQMQKLFSLYNSLSHASVKKHGKNTLTLQF